MDSEEEQQTERERESEALKGMGIGGGGVTLFKEMSEENEKTDGTERNSLRKEKKIKSV